MFPLLFDSPYFTLYAYPLFMGLAWGFGYFYTQYIFDKENLNSKPLLILFLGLFFSSFLGAKLFFLWFSSGHKIYQYLYANYFWLGGGFVFYGGLIFGLAYYIYYSLVLKRFDFGKSYLLLPGLVFGHAIGRIGCVLAGCCFGSLSDLPWAIKINNELRHPVQIYEASALVAIGLIITLFIKKKKSNIFITTFYLVTYSAIRFILEFFRGDTIRGVSAYSLSNSQLISVVIILVVGVLRLRRF
jgi:phosphatidylglycerol:prolipoprotein diacylglycerol transferase